MKYSDCSWRELAVLYYISKQRKCTTEKLLKKFSNTVLTTERTLFDKKLINQDNYIHVTLLGSEVLFDFKEYKKTLRSSKTFEAVISISSAIIGVVVGFLLSWIQLKTK